MCNTDLSDCLCECPPMPGGGALTFNYNLDYEHGGPTCDWPFNIDCENKPNYCSRCEAWQVSLYLFRIFIFLLFFIYKL